MVAADSEQAEVNSPMAANAHQPSKDQTNTRTNGNGNNNDDDNGGISYPFPSLGRQSSIYSLTLDEFQHTLCESGKSFGSMNMDEFLNSIWTAEENQNQVHPSHLNPQKDTPPNAHVAAHPQLGVAPRVIAKQPSLPRQSSLTLPAPLCRKTVDEDWSEIQRNQHQGQGGASNQSNSSRAGPSSGPTQRQPTFGEMTLEDFLIKAGVVREQGNAGLAPPPADPPARHQQQPFPAPGQYGMYQNGSNPGQVGPTYGAGPGPVMAMPGGYPAGEEPSAYPAGGGKRNNGYMPLGPPGGVCYGGAGVGNGGLPGGGYGPGIGIASPVSPMGSEGLEDGSVGHYGMAVGALRGRKRTLDGPVEKVVERRQRRMIKNRESAARSRTRKQAYTVELEAELNQLREENAQLKQALVILPKPGRDRETPKSAAVSRGAAKQSAEGAGQAEADKEEQEQPIVAVEGNRVAGSYHGDTE